MFWPCGVWSVETCRCSRRGQRLRVTSAYPPTKRSRRSSRTASLPYPALCVKTNEAETSEGEADDWWYGYTRERCERIFSRSGFMGESHVHVIANLLQREIAVVD